MTFYRTHSNNLVSSSDGLTIGSGGWRSNNAEGWYKVFKFNGEDWVQKGNTIKGSEESKSWFGFQSSMSADGNIVAIGEDGYSNSNFGRVIVYKFLNNKWIQLGKDIVGEEINGYLGADVELSRNGNMLAVGEFSTSKSSVYIYELEFGDWILKKTLTNNDASEFGKSISMSSNGDIIAISDISSDKSNTNAGEVFVYRRNGDDWIKDDFEFLGDNDSDKFGTRLSISSDGSILAISAPYYDNQFDDSGSVFIFKYENQTWNKLDIQLSGISQNNYFGSSVNLSNDGRILTVGAESDDEFLNDAGKFYVYDLQDFDSPSALETTVDVIEQVEKVINLKATDPNNDSLSYVIQTLPENGILKYEDQILVLNDLPKTINSSAISYTSNSDYAIEDGFTFKVNDGSLDSEIANVMISIEPVNDPPTDILLSSNSLDENLENFVFAEITSVDPDSFDEKFIYEFVEGEGDVDNELFVIDSISLKNKNAFDFEIKSSYSIRIKSTDSTGEFYEESFSIEIKNINDIAIEFESSQTLCDGEDAIGAITIESSNTNGEVTYTWTGPDGFSSNEKDLTGLSSGEYTVTVKDDFHEKEFVTNVEKKSVFDGLEICYVTSDNENFKNNRIYLSYSGIYNDDIYEILREGSSAGVYEKIGELSSGETTFLDSDSNNTSESYSYKVRLKDNCGDFSEDSSNHKTILLQSSIATDNSVNLSWNSYIGKSYSTYKIYRSVNNDDFEEIAAISSNNNTYNDTSADVTKNAYTYYVAISIDNCETTRSSSANPVTEAVLELPVIVTLSFPVIDTV